ncbi:MAG: type I DNA topoisomerase [Candidatus Moranbacteria bacterium]|nr:type I DNA topoisomerase [Candidatus Moranbacteria bacterium]
MTLIIVESPTKAKTISKFLGPKFTVKSSFGHIRDLPEREMGIDVENDFAPKYVVNRKAQEKVKPLKADAKKADFVILATDEDREGEAIAWHLSEILKLKPDEKNRIVFHEITKTAIQKALDSPRKINFDLVDAQQARRILDRLVGFELSPLLWKKIKYGLSAGRVQSIALRIIAEREREIEKFKKEEYWTITAQLETKSPIGDLVSKNYFEATLTHQNDKKIEETVTLKLFAGDYKTKKSTIKDEKTAGEIKAELEKAAFKVSEIAKKETTRTPPPPFTTSTLQQAAINSLGYSAKTTMMLAQKLYEQGHITYMRTDSTNLSMESMLAARKTIEKKFGSEYALGSPRFYKTKSKGAQEAHEAIRPTNPAQTPEDLAKLDDRQRKLYALIWRRMVASQMQPAVLNSVKVLIGAKGSPCSFAQNQDQQNEVISKQVSEQKKERGAKNEYILQANGSTVKFDGYLKVYGDKMPVSENLLPDLKEKEGLDLEKINTAQKFTTPPPRYSEATLVKVLEEYGIGRPSTYAPTISTIIDRKYVEKNEEKKLQPLEIGLLVNDLLVEHFPGIVDMRFTAQMEEDLDKVAGGEKKWVPIVKKFYDPFHENLVSKSKEIKKEDMLEKLDRKCPECGGDLLVKFGRFGKFIACSKYPECKYTEKTEDEKKFEEENSGEVCEKCGAPMVVKRGRFGPFLGCSKYPECKNIKPIVKKTGVQCPKCEEGEIVERKSKRGRIFYGCSRYPDCDYSLWNKPTGETCPQCGGLLTFAAKGKQKCANKECGYEKS